MRTAQNWNPVLCHGDWRFTAVTWMYGEQKWSTFCDEKFATWYWDENFYLGLLYSSVSVVAKLDCVNLNGLGDTKGLVEYTSGHVWVGPGSVTLGTASGPLLFPLWHCPLPLPRKGTALLLSSFALLLSPSPRCSCLAATNPLKPWTKFNLSFFKSWVSGIVFQQHES